MREPELQGNLLPNCTAAWLCAPLSCALLQALAKRCNAIGNSTAKGKQTQPVLSIQHGRGEQHRLFWAAAPSPSTGRCCCPTQQAAPARVRSHLTRLASLLHFLKLAPLTARGVRRAVAGGALQGVGCWVLGQGQQHVMAIAAMGLRGSIHNRMVRRLL